MIHPRFRPAIAAVFISAVLGVPDARAQAREARPAPVGAAERAQPPVQTPADVEPTPAAPQAPVVGLNQNARETRAQFYRILEQYPPALGRVLRLDPTLLTNQGYLASYPKVAAFLGQYPDIARNPAFYLERYEEHYGYREPADPRREAINMWRDAIQFSGAFLVFAVITFALFSLIKYIVEYRRWHRISKLNAEVHNKIMDRFGSNEELLAYIDSPAGRRFLEASPIAPSGIAPRVGAPFGRILLSVQLGVLLIALAVSLWIVSNRAVDEVQQLLLAVSIIGFGLGAGCVISAGASYVLSRRLGLLQDAPAVPPAQSVG